jgi:hypothetical protein
MRAHGTDFMAVAAAGLHRFANSLQFPLDGLVVVMGACGKVRDSA